MKPVSIRTVLVVGVVCLVIGGFFGIFAGLFSFSSLKMFFGGMGSERFSEVSKPQELDRPAFRLQYPSNWHVDVNDKDYDPDHMFSIDSPGHSFVMFVIGKLDSDPGKNLDNNIARFSKLLENAQITRYEKYGALAGKGAILKGKAMGVSETVKVFCFSTDGLTLMITSEVPDDDGKYVEDGIALIENSLRLKADSGSK